MRSRALIVAALVAGCAGEDLDQPVVIDLAAAVDADHAAELTRTFAVAGEREVRILAGDAAIVVEAWVDDGAFAPDAAAWIAPHPAQGEITVVITGERDVTLTVWARGTPPPPVSRDRTLAWFDDALLDDPSMISFAGVLAAISEDGHGGALLARWFQAFATGPGAGRATFAQFLDEVQADQGADPTGWDLAALPFKVTGVHNRLDLARGDDCGELRVSVASTHPTFSPVHLLFLFHQAPTADDVTPDGEVHCRGTARRWAWLTALDDAAWRVAARELLAAGITRDRFALAESVELSLSPWQWRQWVPDGTGGLTNPLLFETVDVERVNTPGPSRDAFLAVVTTDAAAIAARTWVVPDAFRSQVAEVQPNVQAALVDLSPLTDLLAIYPKLPRAIGMIGCPRCHTDTADFVQTGVDRRPSFFYDLELDARAERLDALVRGEVVPVAPFGPLQEP